MSSVSWSVDGGDGEPVAFAAPPSEELGRPLADSFVLARTTAMAVLVQTIRVHSTGCLLDVQWIRRRRGESAGDWDAAQAEAREFLIDYLDDADGLRIGVEPADPAPRSLGFMSGSLRSDDDRITGDAALWLTPLPTSGTRLVCSWDRYGIALSAHDLDVDAIEAAARLVVSPWA